MIIFDDPMKVADARSPAVRKRVQEYFDETLFSRLDDKKSGILIALQQRLHKEDLIGYLAEKGSFELLSLPAIATCDEHFPMSRGRAFARRQGEALFPEREPLETLAEIRVTLGPAAFEAQYQQDPTTVGGGYVDWSWFKTYDERLPREQYRFVVQSWDTAGGAGLANDYSVGITFGLIGDVWHVLDIMRGRWVYPDLSKRVEHYWRQWSGDRVIIEYAGSGIPMCQELRQRRYPVVGVPPRGDKIERFEGITGRIAAGDVLIPRAAPWLSEFRRELMDFPAGSHDDQVDAFSQHLTWARRPAFIENVIDRVQNGGRPSGRVRRGTPCYSPPSLRQRIVDSYDRNAPSLPIGGL